MKVERMQGLYFCIDRPRCEAVAELADRRVDEVFDLCCGFDRVGADNFQVWLDTTTVENLAAWVVREKGGSAPATDTTNADALAEFLSLRKDAEDLLEELRQHVVDDHCGVAPDDVGWGHVTGLRYMILRRLTAAADFALRRGEYAEEAPPT